MTIAMILLLSAWIVTVSRAAGNPDLVLGDLNADGAVTPADALMIQRHVAAPVLNETQLTIADVNGDGNVTEDDAIGIIDYYLQKQDHLKFAALELMPENGAQAADPPFELYFPVEVTAQAGKEIRFISLDDDSELETFDASDAGKVIINGNKVTLNPAVDPETDFYIEIDEGAFVDAKGNVFAGISGSDGWSFDSTIYVQEGAVGGDGSSSSPFGTLQEALAAAANGSKIVVMPGDYTLTATITINKQDVKITGQPGANFLLQADARAFSITASGVTIEGLDITSDVPYAKEFIFVNANNVTIKNNTIYGPPQPGPMTDWVVNRALVTSVGASNIAIEGNTFYSLRTGAYLNPNSTGSVENNVVYNTKDGFLVDNATFTFTGNSWGVPPNGFDITLLAGTTYGAPYDDLAALSTANDNASINDQR